MPRYENPPVTLQEYLRGAELTYEYMMREGFAAAEEDGDPPAKRTEDRARRAGGGLQKMIHPGGGTPQPGCKTYHTAHGPVFEVEAGTKLADVLPGKQRPEVSLDRWLAAATLGEHCQDKEAVDYAKDRKELTGGTTGMLVPTEFQGEWIDHWRSNTVLEAAGMRTATMGQRTVTSSRLLADPGVGWRGEGDPLNVDDPTFELVNLVARSVAVRSQATAELAQDSPDFGQQLLNVFARAIATEIDRVGLVGTGTSNQPKGIYNTAGISTVPAVGEPNSYDPFIDGLQLLLEANVPLERANRNVIMSPRTWAYQQKLRTADGQPVKRPSSLENMVYRPTTAIPNDLGVGEDESIAFLGDFTELVLGVRLDAMVEVLRLQTFAENLLLEFVGYARVDFLVRRPSSFVVLSGITG